MTKASFVVPLVAPRRRASMGIFQTVAGAGSVVPGIENLCERVRAAGGTLRAELTGEVCSGCTRRFR